MTWRLDWTERELGDKADAMKRIAAGIARWVKK